MKKFSYEARDQASNKLVKATLQADSEHAAAKLLIDQGFVPLFIKEQTGDGSFFARLNGRITVKDRVVFTRQLATLVGAGLPLTESLRTAMEQTQNKQLQSITQEVMSSVEGGKTLADSLKKHPRVFNNVFTSLVAAGEVSGTLDESLQRVAAQQEKDEAIAGKIKGAMTYPIIVLVVIFGVLAFMLFTVVPQVEKLYEDLNKELPFITAVMVGAADFMARFWWIVIIVVIVAVYFLRQYFKTEGGIKAKDSMILRIPVISRIFKKLYMARLTRTSQTLLSTGVSMIDTLKITADATNNVIIQQSIIRSIEKVKGGKALSTAFENEPVILPLVPQMIKIGEKSGRIDEMMGKVAQVYEDELDEEIKTLSTAIEPVLMVVLAVVAGGMVGAILLPIYSLVNGVNVG